MFNPWNHKPRVVLICEIADRAFLLYSSIWTKARGVGMKQRVDLGLQISTALLMTFAAGLVLFELALWFGDAANSFEALSF